MQRINEPDHQVGFHGTKCVFHSKKIIGILLSSLAALTLTSCGAPGQQLGPDITLACTMFVNPDEYRVGVLMVLGSGGDTSDYIDTSVRELKYPGVTDTLETQNIKSRWATALKDFAFAYKADNQSLQSAASEYLDNEARFLKNRCIDIGFNYSGLS